MSADVEHLTCKEFVEVLTDYLEDALDPAERAEIERHIVICRGCSNYIEQMRSTISLLGRVGEEYARDVGGGGDDDAGGGGNGVAQPSDELLAVFRAWQSGRASS